MSISSVPASLPGILHVPYVGFSCYGPCGRVKIPLALEVKGRPFFDTSKGSHQPPQNFGGLEMSVP